MADNHIERIVVRGDYLSVPLLIWRRFHRPMPGLAERVFDMNPGLAGHGPYLPIGTAVDIPIPVEPAAAEPRLQVTLW